MAKNLECKQCGKEVKNVGDDTIEVTCWRCNMNNFNHDTELEKAKNNKTKDNK